MSKRINYLKKERQRTMPMYLEGYIFQWQSQQIFGGKKKSTRVNIFGFGYVMVTKTLPSFMLQLCNVRIEIILLSRRGVVGFGWKGNELLLLIYKTTIVGFLDLLVSIIQRMLSIVLTLVAQLRLIKVCFKLESKEEVKVAIFYLRS